VCWKAKVDGVDVSVVEAFVVAELEAVVVVWAVVVFEVVSSELCDIESML